MSDFCKTHLVEFLSRNEPITLYSVNISIWIVPIVQTHPITLAPNPLNLTPIHHTHTQLLPYKHQQTHNTSTIAKTLPSHTHPTLSLHTRTPTQTPPHTPTHPKHSHLTHTHTPPTPNGYIENIFFPKNIQFNSSCPCFCLSINQDWVLIWELIRGFIKSRHKMTAWNNFLGNINWFVPSES